MKKNKRQNKANIGLLSVGATQLSWQLFPAAGETPESSTIKLDELTATRDICPQAQIASAINELNKDLAEDEMQAAAAVLPDSWLCHHALQVPPVPLQQRNALIEMQLATEWTEIEQFYVGWQVSSSEAQTKNDVWAVACQRQLWAELSKLKLLSEGDWLLPESSVFAYGLDDQLKASDLVVYVSDGLASIQSWDGKGTRLIGAFPLQNMNAMQAIVGQLARVRQQLSESIGQCHLIVDCCEAVDSEAARSLLARLAEQYSAAIGELIYFGQESSSDRRRLMSAGFRKIADQRLGEIQEQAQEEGPKSLLQTVFSPGPLGFIVAASLLFVFFFLELSRRESELAQLESQMAKVSDGEQSLSPKSQMLARHFMQSKAGPLDVMMAIAGAGENEKGKHPFTLLQLVFEAEKKVTIKVQYQNQDVQEVDGYLSRLSASKTLVDVKPVMARPVTKGINGKPAFEIEIHAGLGRKPKLADMVTASEKNVLENEKEKTPEKLVNAASGKVKAPEPLVEASSEAVKSVKELEVVTTQKKRQVSK